VTGEPIWLELATIVAIHERQISEYGGLSGLRDRALLESAMARARHLYACSEPTVFEMAATYAVGIIKNHPFVDGNKRTGFLAAYTFLRLNGMRLIAPQSEAVSAVLNVAAGEMSEEQFARWLEANVSPS
jgi:death-on-curing protein